MGDRPASVIPFSAKGERIEFTWRTGPHGAERVPAPDHVADVELDFFGSDVVLTVRPADTPLVIGAGPVMGWSAPDRTDAERLELLGELVRRLIGVSDPDGKRAAFEGALAAAWTRQPAGGQ